MSPELASDDEFEGRRFAYEELVKRYGEILTQCAIELQAMCRSGEADMDRICALSDLVNKVIH